MDIASIIIGTLLLIGFIAPLVWVQMKQQNQDGQFLKKCNQIAVNERLTLSVQEVWNRDFFIGIDESKKVLIYVHLVNGLLEQEVIPLNQIISHKLVKTDRSWVVKGQTKSHIERLELQFKLSGNSEKEVKLLFYDAMQSLTLIGELEIIRKWDELIKKELKTSSNGIGSTTNGALDRIINNGIPISPVKSYPATEKAIIKI